MKKLLVLSSAVIAVLVSCNKGPKTNPDATKVYLDLPVEVAKYYDSSAIPSRNNYEATLGRVLFYDTHLSVNNSVSCASCHKQAYAFADNVAFSRGYENKLTGRNSMPIENLSVQGGFTVPPSLSFTSFFWDGRETSLQNLIDRPIANHVEMGIADLGSLPDKLSSLPYYKKLFTDAYGSEEVSGEKISAAIVAFIGAIRSNNSRFDKYEMNHQPLTALELQGMTLFNQKYNCNNCHTIFQGSYASVDFVDIGLDNNYKDAGRGTISGKNTDAGKFRTPNLRNVALTAPYMHDGRFQTLDEVLEHYSHNICNSPNLDERLKDSSGHAHQMNISAQEKQALIAFLNTLTDYSLISDAKFSDPFKLK